MLKFSSRPDLPLILQSETAECGLACVAMISAWHGQSFTLSELRQRYAISLKGSTLKAIMAIADGVGFTSRPLRLELPELKDLKLPCILHWDLTHYVVLRKVSRGMVVIHDPACGLRKLSFSEASLHFTGVALELTPAPNFEKRETVERVRLTDLWSRVSGFVPSIVQILVLSALLEAFGLLSPLINQMIVDDAITKGDMDLLNVILLGAALLLVIQLATGLLRSFVQMHFATHLTFQMRGNLLRHTLRLPIAWFEKRSLGNVLSRFNSLQPLQDMLSGSVVVVTLDGMMAIITLVVMMIYSPLLTGVALASLTILIGIRLITFPWFMRLAAEGIQYQSKLDSIFLETIRGARTFKLFGRERERHAVWQNAYADTVNNGLRVQRVAIKGGAGLSFQSGAEALVTFYLGAKAVIHGDMTLGMLMAFQSFRGQFSSAVDSLVELYFRFRMLGLHMERLADIVHQEAEPGLDRELGQDRPILGGLEVRGLSFRYADHEPWVLRDVAFAASPGEFVAFVGPSGGGKSSLLKLLMGFYPPAEGEISIDGVPMRAMGIHSFREQIGAVMQDDQLFAGTVADNIAFFDPSTDMERVEEVARLASVHDEILRMPMGYMTLIGDLGSTLSGGQRQRVLLARALYRKPAILFLDEGTANLDVLAERRIMQVFKELKITRIVAAHRPTAIEGADRVFAVEGGRVRELSRDTAMEAALHVVGEEG